MTDSWQTRQDHFLCAKISEWEHSCTVFEFSVSTTYCRADKQGNTGQHKKQRHCTEGNRCVDSYLLQILQQIFGIEHRDEWGGGSGDDDDGSPGPFSQNKQTNKAKEKKSCFKVHCNFRINAKIVCTQMSLMYLSSGLVEVWLVKLERIKKAENVKIRNDTNRILTACLKRDD